LHDPVAPTWKLRDFVKTIWKFVKFQIGQVGTGASVARLRRTYSRFRQSAPPLKK